MLKFEVNLPQAKIIMEALSSQPYKDIAPLMRRFEEYINNLTMINPLPVAEKPVEKTPAKRGRGRPRGSKNRKTSKKVAA